MTDPDPAVCPRRGAPSDSPTFDKSGKQSLGSSCNCWQEARQEYLDSTLPGTPAIYLYGVADAQLNIQTIGNFPEGSVGVANFDSYHTDLGTSIFQGVDYAVASNSPIFGDALIHRPTDRPELNRKPRHELKKKNRKPGSKQG